MSRRAIAAGLGPSADVVAGMAAGGVSAAVGVGAAGVVGLGVAGALSDAEAAGALASATWLGLAAGGG